SYLRDRTLATGRRAQSLTGQLSLPGLRVAPDEILERLAGSGRLPELLLAERELVERGRDLVALRRERFDPGVLGGGAVELRLREVALPDPVLRVVGELGVGEA